VLLIRIAPRAIVWFCADLEPDAHVITHLYKHTENSYHLNNLNIVMFAWPALLELARCFPAISILGASPKPHNPPELAHWVAIFQILGSVSRVTESAAAIARVTTPFPGFVRENQPSINKKEKHKVDLIDCPSDWQIYGFHMNPC
jgi:hypothetical protein